MPDLTNIKPGDLIAYKSEYPTGGRLDALHPLPFKLYKVERVTKTQGMFKRGYAEVRFRLSDGRIIGGYHFRYVFVPTQEQLDEVRPIMKQRKRLAEAIAWFESLRIDQLSVEQLEAMRAALKTQEAGQ